MKTHTIQAGDTFYSIAKQYKIKSAPILKNYHNLNCDIEDIIEGKPPVGKTLLIPEDEELTYSDAQLKAIQDAEMASKAEEQQEKEKEQKERTQKETKSGASAHEGKYFVIQRGVCQCDQGCSFPQFKVTSHTKHYWNDANGQNDYLAVTEDDLSFNPNSFGDCKLKPTTNGFLPCAYAPAGKWQIPYEKVKVTGKSCLTEISFLMCAAGGKITVKSHGQQDEISTKQMLSADSDEMNSYNATVNFDEFKDEISDEFEYQ